MKNYQKEEIIIFFKANTNKLLLAFAKIVDSDKQITQIAHALSILEPYSLFNSTKLISKKEIYKIISECKNLSKYREIPTKKFLKKFIKNLFRKGIIEISETSEDLESNEIAIIPINKYILITNNLQTVRFNDIFI